MEIMGVDRPDRTCKNVKLDHLPRDKNISKKCLKPPPICATKTSARGFLTFLPVYQPKGFPVHELCQILGFPILKHIIYISSQWILCRPTNTSIRKQQVKAEKKWGYMGVSKNRGGPPKWMVKIMENPIKMDDLGVPLFLETPTCSSLKCHICSTFCFRTKFQLQHLGFPSKRWLNQPI